MGLSWVGFSCKTHDGVDTGICLSPSSPLTLQQACLISGLLSVTKLKMFPGKQGVCFSSSLTMPRSTWCAYNSSYGSHWWTSWAQPEVISRQPASGSEAHSAGRRSEVPSRAAEATLGSGDWLPSKCFQVMWQDLDVNYTKTENQIRDSLQPYSRPLREPLPINISSVLLQDPSPPPAPTPLSDYELSLWLSAAFSIRLIEDPVIVTPHMSRKQKTPQLL